MADTADNLPCCDPISPESINRWFDYWLAQTRDDTSSRAGARRETIERLRQCALEGARKAKKNKKQRDVAVAHALRCMADEIERRHNEGGRSNG